jgi:excisionase family DNA binding protein
MALEKILLTPEEAAEVLGIGKCTVYDLIRMRLLRSVKIGRSRRIPVEACREMVARMLDEESAA